MSRFQNYCHMAGKTHAANFALVKYKTVTLPNEKAIFIKDFALKFRLIYGSFPHETDYPPRLLSRKERSSNHILVYLWGHFIYK